jgi:hypothetical protein
MLAPGQTLPEDGGGRGKGRSKVATLWVAGEAGLTRVSVETGLRGANCTEVTGEGISEGMSLVIGAEAVASSSTSPLSASKSAGGFRGGGF